MRSDLRFILAVIALVLVLTSLPYAYAYLSTPAEKHFVGIMLDVPDHAQYFSWFRDLGSANLVSNKLTPEPNGAIFFNLLWWGLARLGKLLGLDYAAMFQVMRILSITLFLLLVYRLCAWFFEERLQRRTAFLLIAFTSGFGWVLVVLKYALHLSDPPSPLLVYIAEGNTFLGMLGYPHFIAAALYIFTFDLLLLGERRGQLRYAVAAGLFAQFMGWQHAYDLVLVWGILGAYGLLKIARDRKIPPYLLKAGIIIGALSLWPALYSVWLTSADPLWKAVLKQFANAGVYTPNLLQLPVLFGVPLILAILSVIGDNPFRLKNYDDRLLFITAWFLSSFVLIYIPTDFQIHMLNGWQVPMGLLAVRGLFRYVAPRWPRLAVRPVLWATLLLLVVVPTNLYLFTWRFVELRRHDYPYYLYQDEMSAYGWLEANARPAEGQPYPVIFSAEMTGQYVPLFSGAQAYLAHWAQTLDYYGKAANVQEFFASATSEARRLEILRQHGVDYVLYGPAERAVGPYDPAMAPFLKPVFQTQRVSVYAVSP